jgi:trehalose 6-phosphate phosphatase
VISQFEGYGDLAELDWDGYRTRYGDIQRLDRILEAEGDDVNRYQVSKQADALMLFYLLSADELGGLLDRLGHGLERAAIPRTIDYYLARTSHGSTLSAVVHAWVLARAHRDRAVEFFERALRADVADIQGGTTAEGIHLAAMTGSLDLLQRCFSGLETRGDRLLLDPYWPESLGVLTLSVWYRDCPLRLRISGREIEVAADAGGQGPVRVACRGRVVDLKPGYTTRFPC